MKPSRILSAVTVCCLTFCAHGPTVSCHNVVDRDAPPEEDGYTPTVYRNDGELAEAFESVKENYFKETEVTEEEQEGRPSIKGSWGSFLGVLYEEISHAMDKRIVTHFYLPAIIISSIGYLVLIVIASLVFRCEGCKGCANVSNCSISGHCCCICASVASKSPCATCQKCDNCARRNQWIKNSCILVCFTWVYWYASSPLVALPVALIITEAFYAVPHEHESGEQQK